MKSTLINLTSTSIFVCAAFIGNAVAQDKAAPAAAPTAATPAATALAVRPPPTASSAATELAAVPADILAKVEKHSCKGPEEPGKLATAAAQKGFRNDLETYRECISKYTEVAQQPARAHIASANAAAADYNEFVEKIKKDREAKK